MWFQNHFLAPFSNANEGWKRTLVKAKYVYVWGSATPSWKWQKYSINRMCSICFTLHCMHSFGEGDASCDGGKRHRSRVKVVARGFQVAMHSVPAMAQLRWLLRRRCAMGARRRRRDVSMYFDSNGGGGRGGKSVSLSHDLRCFHSCNWAEVRAKKLFPVFYLYTVNKLTSYFGPLWRR